MHGTIVGRTFARSSPRRATRGALPRSRRNGGDRGLERDAIERALGLGVLASVRARDGDVATAEEKTREAVEVVERTDFLFDRGTVLLDLGDVDGATWP